MSLRLKTGPRRAGRATGRIAILAGAVLALSSLAVVPSTAAVFPTLATDKPDYHPDETVHITGTGYEPAAGYDVPVMRPDGSMVHGDGSGLPGWDSVTADGSGDLAYDYVLDGIFGVYEARVYASPWSGDWNQAPLTAVTFTDGANLDQCANDEPGTPPCAWQNGNLNGNNSAYAEGDVVPFRLRVDALAPGAHTIHLNYDFTQGGNKAYDFLATYNATETVAICGPGGGGAPSSLCPVGAPTDTAPFQPDPFVSDGIQVSAVQAAFGGAQELSIWGGMITSISVPFHDGPDLTGNSTADITVNFTSIGDSVILAWGGHIARSVDWNGKGAGQISGAPWHMRTQFLDGGGASNEDRSIQPSALVPGSSITVIKNTVPDNVEDFVFQPSAGVNGGISFILDDDGPGGSATPSQLTFPVEPGPHTVTEGPEDLFILDSITCVDPTNNSSGSTGTRIATFDVGVGENVTCTFHNVERVAPAPGRIVVRKVVVGPASDQQFPFTSSFDGDIANGTDFALVGGQSFDSGPLVPGTFAVNEIVPDGWSLVSASCDDGSPIGAIVLSVGETVTCTFTDERLPPPPPRPYDTYDDDPGTPDFDFDTPFDDAGGSDVDSNDDTVTDVAGTNQDQTADPQPVAPSVGGDQLGAAVPAGGSDYFGGISSADPDASVNPAVAPQALSQLPRTGTAPNRLVALGLLLMAIGALTVGACRNRRAEVQA